MRTPPFTVASAQIFGNPVKFANVEGFFYSLKEIFNDEVYKFESDTKSPLIIDAGANIGLSVIYFKRAYPESKIVAYEPDPTMFELLSQNVKAWGFKDVELRNAAAWTEDGQLTFYTEGSLAGSSEVNFANKGNAVQVRSERLRDQMAGKKVDFLKIDIEGAENHVLPDIETQLPGVKALFFEYHSAPGKPQRLADLLSIAARQGFRYVISGPHGARFPFVDRTTTGFDLQLNVSCFRP